MRVDTARYIAFSTTSLVVFAGGLWILFHADSEAANLPIGGPLGRAPDGGYAIEVMTHALVALMSTISAGVFVFAALSQKAAWADPTMRRIRGMVLTIYWLALVCALGSAIPMVKFAPIAWIRPLFYAPLAMVAGAVVVACIYSWTDSRKPRREADS